MTLTFDGFEIDPDGRELRVDGAARALQPQVFDLLCYLVEHRNRVVSKRELLDALWPDSVVTESSIQRAISLARSALGPSGPDFIRTYPRQGYRFVGEPIAPGRGPEEAPLRPRYAQSGDVHVAYHVVGEGDVDLVMINGWTLPMQSLFSLPEPRQYVNALSKIGRLILFDKRGTGLSDRVKELPGLEQRMEDLRVVLDACDSEQAILIGYSEGGPLSVLYAATYPERTRGLLLCASMARLTNAPGYPHGLGSEQIERLRGYIRGGWGKGATMIAVARSQSNDPDFRRWCSSCEQLGCSPGGALDLLEMNAQIDVRALLPTVRVPTVVMHHESDSLTPVGNGRFLAEQIPDARYIEVPGGDHVFFFDGLEITLDAIQWLLAQEIPELEDDRFLSTVLVARTNDVLDEQDWRTEVRRFRGEPVSGGLRAYFDGPARAIRCGQAVATRLGLSCGVHTGALLRRGRSIAGQAWSTAEELAEQAPPGSVWTSQVVADLVPGSDVDLRPVESDSQQAGRYELRNR